MSLQKAGPTNYLFGKSLPIATLDAAAAVNGTKVYAYDSQWNMINGGNPFSNITEA